MAVRGRDQYRAVVVAVRGRDQVVVVVADRDQAVEVEGDWGQAVEEAVVAVAAEAAERQQLE